MDLFINGIKVGAAVNLTYIPTVNNPFKVDFLYHFDTTKIDLKRLSLLAHIEYLKYKEASM